MAEILPQVASLRSAGWLDQGETFDVVRHREHVEGRQLGQLPAVPGERGQVAGERGRVAGYVGDPAQPWAGAQPVDEVAADSSPGRVYDRDRRAGQPDPPEHLGRVPAVYPRPRGRTQVVPGVADRGLVLLDTDHGAFWPDGVGQHAGEQPCPAEQVERRLARLRREPAEHGRRQRVGCGRMHLPEPGRRHPPVPPGGVLDQELGLLAAVHYYGSLTAGWGYRDLD